MKTKVLVFNGYYTPAKNYGGPLTSMRNIVNSCSNEFDFFIISYDHDFGSKEQFAGIKHGWQNVGQASVKYVSDNELAFSRRNIDRMLSEIKPDMIWFTGVLTPQIRLVTVLLSKKLRIPILMSPRGEVSADRICMKGYKKKPYLFVMRNLGFYKDAFFHATSDDEVLGIKKYLGGTDDRIFEVANIGPTVQESRTDYIKQEGNLRIVFISRIHPLKNLKFAIEIVLELKGNVIFDIYGPLEDKEYWKECEKLIKDKPSNVEIAYRGELVSEEVSATFRKYDCFLFPTINENYGHVIAESLASGCPVILSKGTTPWDDIDGVAGFVYCLNMKETFIAKLQKMVYMKHEEYKILSNDTWQYYSNNIRQKAIVSNTKEMIFCVIKAYSKKELNRCLDEI